MNEKKKQKACDESQKEEGRHEKKIDEENNKFNVQLLR